jgi:LuxR family maltose regulon positive regulatory protein
MTAIARGHLWRGDPGHAGQVLEQAIEATTRSVDTLARWELANVCAFRWLIEGKLYRAAAGYDQVVQAAGERLVFAREVALLGLALLAYEGNHLDQAAAHLDLVAAIRQQVGRSVIQLPFAAVLRGRVLRAQGRLDLADQAFENAEKAARHVSSTRLRLARAERARVALGDGNLAEAARWAEEIDLDRIHQYAWEPEALMLARVRRAQVRGATVVPLLERLLASAEALGRGDSVVAILVQLSLAREQDNDHAGGLAALEEAVAFAEPAGYTRAFLDEGEPMLLQLRRLLKGGAAHGYVVGLVRAFGSAGDGATAGLEVLTPREHDVLRLLAVGLSNRAIAERLVTSEGTVKSHVHRLIAKLGVASRAQVIVRARELGTLPAVDVHGR